jgi:hypothetical protein
VVLLASVLHLARCCSAQTSTSQMTGGHAFDFGVLGVVLTWGLLQVTWVSLAVG